jgi:hypothetical protein
VPAVLPKRIWPLRENTGFICLPKNTDPAALQSPDDGNNLLGFRSPEKKVGPADAPINQFSEIRLLGFVFDCADADSERMPTKKQIRYLLKDLVILNRDFPVIYPSCRDQIYTWHK